MLQQNIFPDELQQSIPDKMQQNIFPDKMQQIKMAWEKQNPSSIAIINRKPRISYFEW